MSEEEVLKFYKTSEVAEIFSVRIYTVREWIAQGKVKAARVNGQWRIRHDEIVRLSDEFMEAGGR